VLTQILKNLSRRKTRTVLTVSGIAVGVAMIVTLGAMSEGSRTGYASVFSGSGADLAMILKESLTVSLIGVVVGIGLAMALSPLLKSIPMYGSMTAVVVSPGLLTRVLIVAVGLGAVGGLYPAWRAANLSPVEALRYE